MQGRLKSLASLLCIYISTKLEPVPTKETVMVMCLIQTAEVSCSFC